ncbi:TPA: hypothetical protein ACH3X3_015162 [Trebouxia sp. C0006]
MFSEDMKPGKTFWKDDVFDISERPDGPFYHEPGDITLPADGPFYNLPGYLDNFKGTKKMYRKPLFRGNSTADPDDIRSPHFDDCAVPLVWWPWWPENPSDFFLTSVAPFHAMLHGGVIDKNIKYTPVMEGLKQPGYFQWYSDPITNFPVESLEDMSDRRRLGERCWERIILCKPFSIWFLRPNVDKPWHDGLMYGTLGQEVVDFQISKGLRVIDKPADVFRIAFIERKHKRRIVNFQEVLDKCQAWQLPTGTKYKHAECRTINLDDSKKFPEQLSQLQSLDALVGVHGAGLINHNFMKPNSSFVEIMPCKFGGEWPSQYFQVPAEKERVTFYWRLQAHKRKHCYPSPLQTRKGRNHPDVSTEEWVAGSLIRDQDLTVDARQLLIMLGRIASMDGDRDEYEDKARHDPAYPRGTQ